MIISLLRNWDARIIKNYFRADEAIKKIDFIKFTFFKLLARKYVLTAFKFFLIIINFEMVTMPLVTRIFFLIFIIIPYARITYFQIKKVKKQKKYVNKSRGIFFNSDRYDWKQRLYLNRKKTKLIFNFFIMFMLFIHFLMPFFVTEIELQSYKKNIPFLFEMFFVFYFSSRIFSYLYIRLLNTSSLVAVLLLSNPIFSLSFLLLLFDPINQFVTNERLFNNYADSGVYIFLETGFASGFVLVSLLYSFLFQLLYVTIQPVYKIEKSRFAVEILATITSIILVIGLIYSKGLAEFLFNYVTNDFDLKQEFLSYVKQAKIPNMDTLEGFTAFFEKTLRLIFLPFTVCSAIVLLIFKHRESEAKRKANKYFQDLTMRINPLSKEEEISILQKAFYYGGSNIKNSIVSDPRLKKLTLDHLMVHSKNKINGLKKAIRILIRFHRGSFFYLVYSMKYTSQMNWIKTKIQIILTKEEFIQFKHAYKEYSISKKIKNFLKVSILLFAIFLYLYLLISGKLVYIYSKYLNVFNNNDNESNRIFFFFVFIIVLYSLFLRFRKQDKQNQYERNIKRKQTIRLFVSLIVLSSMIIIYIISNTTGINILFIIKASSFYIVWFFLQLQIDSKNRKK